MRDAVDLEIKIEAEMLDGIREEHGWAENAKEVADGLKNVMATTEAKLFAENVYEFAEKKLYEGQNNPFELFFEEGQTRCVEFLRFPKPCLP